MTRRQFEVPYQAKLVQTLKSLYIKQEKERKLLQNFKHLGGVTRQTFLNLKTRRKFYVESFYTKVTEIPVYKFEIISLLAQALIVTIQ